MALRDISLDDKFTAAAMTTQWLIMSFLRWHLLRRYIASEKKIPPKTVQEMMRRSLYHIKWYFGRTDLNTEKGKAENKKSVVKYAK